MPLYPYGPNEALLDDSGHSAQSAIGAHLMGTDDRGRDVLVRLAYGFNISMTFAIVVTIVGEGLGIAIGAMLGLPRSRPRRWASTRSASHPPGTPIPK